MAVPSTKLILTVLVIFACLLCSFVPVSGKKSAACSTKTGGCTKDKDGIIFPAWRPFEISTGMKFLRGIVYLLALCYMFLGVAIIADKFMAAIEVITSKVRIYLCIYILWYQVKILEGVVEKKEKEEIY